MWKPWWYANITLLLVPDDPQWGFAKRFLSNMINCRFWMVTGVSWVTTAHNVFLIQSFYLRLPFICLSYYFSEQAAYKQFVFTPFLLLVSIILASTLGPVLEASKESPNIGLWAWSFMIWLFYLAWISNRWHILGICYRKPQATLFFFLLQFQSPQMVWWFISVWLSNHNSVYAACHKESAFIQTFVLSYSLVLCYLSL